MARITCIPRRLRYVNCRIDGDHPGILPLMASAAGSGGHRAMVERGIEECRTIPPARTTRAGRSMARDTIRSGGGYVPGAHRLRQQCRPVMTAVATFVVRHRRCRAERGISRGCIDMVENDAGKTHAIGTPCRIGRNRGVATAAVAVRRCHHMARNLAGSSRSIVAGRTGRRGRRSISRERGIYARYM